MNPKNSFTSMNNQSNSNKIRQSILENLQFDDESIPLLQINPQTQVKNQKRLPIPVPNTLCEYVDVS